MDAQVTFDQLTQKHIITIRISNNEIVGGTLNLTEAINSAAKEIAIDWVNKNQASVLENLNPIAVSNLAIAEAAYFVRDKFVNPTKKAKE